MDIVRIQGETLCQEIAMNHSKCDYARLLERYCPLSSSHKATSQNLDDDVTPSQDPSDTECTQLRLIKSYYTAESAGSFIKAVISRLFPLQFWGSQVNLDVFLETLMRFIALQRGETFTLKTIMHRIRVMDMKWLIGTADRTAISRFMHQAICYSVKNIFKWVYCVIVIPLLRSAFYITDTQLSKYPIFYRKPIWSRIKFLALTELESSKQFEKKGCQLSSANKLGASKLRFLPKTSGLRPIANLAMPYWDSSMLERPKKVLCTNAILRKVFEVLKYELQSKPTSFGFGMQYDHIHSRFVDFMIKVQERRLQAPSTETNIYFASVDIHRCFDNINQDFLFKILEGFIAEV
jgi:telomerase reverse transcriptase